MRWPGIGRRSRSGRIDRALFVHYEFQRPRELTLTAIVPALIAWLCPLSGTLCRILATGDDLKRIAGMDFRAHRRAAGPEIVRPKAAVLIAMKRSFPHRIPKSNAYHLSCNSRAMCIGVERGSPILSSSSLSSSSLSSSRPLRRACTLRRATGRVVRVVHAQSGRQRSRPVLQSGALVGALWIQRGRSVGWRHRRLAPSRRKNRRPGKWPMDRAERQ